jgi:hypothetical protein
LIRFARLNTLRNRIMSAQEGLPLAGRFDATRPAKQRIQRTWSMFS